MSDHKNDSKVGYRRPPAHSRFRPGQKPVILRVALRVRPIFGPIFVMSFLSIFVFAKANATSRFRNRGRCLRPWWQRPLGATRGRPMSCSGWCRSSLKRRRRLNQCRTSPLTTKPSLNAFWPDGYQRKRQNLEPTAPSVPLTASQRSHDHGVEHHG